MASERPVATSARFLFRSLALRSRSFLLAFLAIMVGASVTATMLNLKADLRVKMSRELRRFGPNLILVPREGEAGATLGEGPVRQVRGVSPLLLAPGSIVSPAAAPAGAAPNAATIVGADFDALRRLYPSWRISGRWPAGSKGPATGSASSAPGCLLGTSLAARAGLKAGDRVVLRLSSGETALTVAGTVSTGETEDEEVFVPLAWLQDQIGLRGRVSLAALAIDGGEAEVERAARAIEAVLPESSARPLRPIAAAQGALLQKLQRMMSLMTSVVLLLCGLSLVTTLVSMVVEREGEIGVLRSLGARDGDIVKMFCGEVGLLGGSGALVGLALGAAAARLIGLRLFGAAIEARLWVVPRVLLVSAALCLIGVLLALRRALAVQPAAVLGGE